MFLILNIYYYELTIRLLFILELKQHVFEIPTQLLLLLLLHRLLRGFDKEYKQEMNDDTPQ